MPAPQDVTVQTVVKREEWTGNDGTQMVTYEVVLEGEGQVRKAVKPLSKDPKPEAGQAKAWIDTPGKISFADPNFTPRGGGGSGGGRSDGGYSPETQARITRSHSQEMALLLIEASEHAKGLNLDTHAEVSNYLNNVVKKITDWFDKDVREAGDAAKPAPQNTNGGDPAPVAATNPDDEIPF
jgi:hypothetical protein